MATNYDMYDASLIKPSPIYEKISDSCNKEIDMLMKECLKAQFGSQSCLLSEDVSDKSIEVRRPKEKQRITKRKKEGTIMESKVSVAPSDSSLNESKITSNLEQSKSVVSNALSSKVSVGKDASKKDKEHDEKPEDEKYLGMPLPENLLKQMKVIERLLTQNK